MRRPWGGAPQELCVNRGTGATPQITHLGALEGSYQHLVMQSP